MKPKVEKITNPANTLVPQLITEIIMASLQNTKLSLVSTTSRNITPSDSRVEKVCLACLPKYVVVELIVATHCYQ